VPTCYRHPGRETYIRCQRCDRPICPDCMRDAAVGFQCKKCVAEGSKTTRSGRTPYGGERPRNPRLTSGVLTAINAFVFLLIQATGAYKSEWIERLALIPNGRCIDDESHGAYAITSQTTCSVQEAFSGGPTTWFPGVAEGTWWQLGTSMFTHVAVWHVAFNLLALWQLGPQLELVFGRVRFLGLYLLSGLTGSAFVYWLSEPYSATLGASGALFGLMGALLVVAHKVGGDTRTILGWIGINFLITILASSFISWQGHLGGFVGGVILAGAIVYAPKQNRALWQYAGLAGVALAVAVAIVARTAALA